MDSYARFGYSLTPNMMDVLKRKDFAQWQARKGIPDAFLCKAVSELNGGLVHANLGGSLYKHRIALPGRGKRGGCRTLLSAKIGNRYVFLYGFLKGDRANITREEAKALQYAGRVFLELSADARLRALESGVLLEVHCEQNHRGIT